MKIAEKIVSKTELSVVLCVASLILFLWPFLSDSILSSLKSLFFYIFTIWPMVIGILLIFSRRLDSGDTGNNPGGIGNP